VTDFVGCAAAWPREETSDWIRRMRADTVYRDVDGWASGTAFLTQMRLMPDMLVAAVEHRSDGITVVRHPFKVDSMRTYRQSRAQMTAFSHTAQA